MFNFKYIAEAEAAKKAGCKVLIIDRPSNDPCTPDDKAKFEFITSFDQLIPEEWKRKNNKGYII